MLYDTALAITFLSLSGRHEQARGLLLTLSHLQSQNADGSLGYGWNCWGDGFYNSNYVRCGSIAWAGYGAAMYERMSGDRSFRAFSEKLADFVLSQQVKDAPDSTDPRRGLITGGRGRWAGDYSKFDKTEVINWACAEHNIDCYFLLRDLGALTGTTRYESAARSIREAMLRALWSEEEGRFFPGIAADGKLDRGHALDAAFWGACFLAINEPAKARRALAYAERTFRSTACGESGYKPYAGNYSEHPMHDWGPRMQMVWSEGTLGMALAYLRLGEVEECRKLEEQVVAGMQVPGGGVRYSVYADDLPIPESAIARVNGAKPTDVLADFVRCPSAAGTLWLALLQWSRENRSTAFWGAQPPPAATRPSQAKTVLDLHQQDTPVSKLFEAKCRAAREAYDVLLVRAELQRPDFSLVLMWLQRLGAAEYAVARDRDAQLAAIKGRLARVREWEKIALVRHEAGLDGKSDLLAFRFERLSAEVALAGATSRPSDSDRAALVAITREACLLSVSPYDVSTWSKRWMDNELLLAADKTREIAVVKEHVRRLSELERQLNAQFEAGSVPRREQLAAQSYRLEAEILLARMERKTHEIVLLQQQRIQLLEGICNELRTPDSRVDRADLRLITLLMTTEANLANVRISLLKAQRKTDALAAAKKDYLASMTGYRERITKRLVFDATRLDVLRAQHECLEAELAGFLDVAD